MNNRQRWKEEIQKIKLEALLTQIPKEQLAEIVSDMQLIGIAYEAGSDYRAVALKLSNKYLGRRRRLFDGIIKNRHFKALLDRFVADSTAATDQPVGDATMEQPA